MLPKKNKPVKKPDFNQEWLVQSWEKTMLTSFSPITHPRVLFLGEGSALKALKDSYLIINRAQRLWSAVDSISCLRWFNYCYL